MTWPATGPLPTFAGVAASSKLNRAQTINEVENNGARLVWQRSTVCPCFDVSGGRTQRPDPTCPRCKGKGRFWFGPDHYSVPAAMGALTPLQEQVRHGGALIHGLIQSKGHRIATSEETYYGEFGRWVEGVMRVTVRPENRLGYFDRLINIDDEVLWSESVLLTARMAAGTDALTLRYSPIDVLALHTLDARVSQFSVNDGVVKLRPDQAAAGTRVSLLYSTFNVWVVTEMPHLPRTAQSAQGSTGAETQQVVQAEISCEFLPAEEATLPR